MITYPPFHCQLAFIQRISFLMVNYKGDLDINMVVKEGRQTFK